jgi:hypothetical protein
MRLLGTCGLALGLGLLVAGCVSRRNREPAVQVMPGRNNPQVAVEIYPNRMVFDVESPQGIGSFTGTLAERVRPKRLTVRLRLRGLEELRFSYAGRTVAGSLASTGNHAVRQSLLTDGAEQSVRYRDRHWMRFWVERGAPMVVPLQGRWIEVDAPPEFLKSGVRTFTVEWVDFFR